jgi:glycosyltransferase involved in cell wall biosynthesis
LRTIIKRWRPAVVHAHFAAAALIAAVAKGLRASPFTTWVATFHGLSGSAPNGGGRSMLAAAETWSANRMAFSFVLNDEDYAYLRAANPASHIVRQPGFGLGCDLPSFDPRRFCQADKARIRCDLGLDAGGPVLAFVGRRTSFKGFPQALDAFQRVRARIPGARLILVGEPDILHGGAAFPKDVSAQTGVIDAGWANDVARVLAVTDLCILPSVREGMPVSLMEALAMGVPCITMDSRGCRDVVRDQVDGLVLPTREPEALATAIISVLQQPHRLNEMGAAALAGRSRFGRCRQVAEQIAVYKSLHDGRSLVMPGISAEA